MHSTMIMVDEKRIGLSQSIATSLDSPQIGHIFIIDRLTNTKYLVDTGVRLSPFARKRTSAQK